MKLETRLNSAPRFLHVVPFLGIVLLLVTFLFLSSNLIGQSGFKADLPQSLSVVPAAGRAHIITLTAGAEPELYLNKELVDWPTLQQRLQEVQTTDYDKKVVIMGDQLTAFGVAIRAGQVALGLGYEVIYATEPGESAPR